ncbi:hypothetical protein [Emcibacter sp. SYSU 3D8]|uniref:hypothetical protein n=1 Tax=Emcibacter sp. SYSU 3D8 TaxID=3133969 RepID=UPI0031FE72A0
MDDTAALKWPVLVAVGLLCLELALSAANLFVISPETKPWVFFGPPGFGHDVLFIALYGAGLCAVVGIYRRARWGEAMNSPAERSRIERAKPLPSAA